MSTAPSTVPATTPAPLPPPSSPSIEQLPANIPCLEPDGSNWAIFVVRFRESMQANRRWGYFDGKITRPEPADPSNVTEDERKSIEKWDHEDLVARYLLSQRLPDSTAVCMGAYPTAKARWDRVNDEFTAKSVYAQNDLESTFYDMRCAKGGDVHVFLTSLRYKREELSAVGVSISDKEYQWTVLKGIPEELARFASGILSSARIFKASTVDTETLIDHICEEVDRLKNRRAKSQSKDPGAKSSATSDDALAATGSGGKKKRRKGDCHNCGKAGHWARDCRSPKKEKPAEDTAKAGKTDKAQKSETKPVGSANAVATQDEAVEDECWAVEFSSGASDPGDDLIDESDWLCKVEETATAVITPVSDDRGERIELYDSGATRHISPYKSDFASYTTLNPPVYLNAANQQRFPAIGTGTLTICAPNGAASSTLTLHEVLHAPAVRYTLVSIGALDKRGYRTSIGGGTLELFSPRGKRVARIPQTTRGLYCTNHIEESANSIETISIMELHRRMGHIAPASARALVEKGLVTGIRLDPDSREADCEACLFARATRKPIPKVCIRPRAQSFGDEVHSDVWGPSSIATKRGCRYFVTFTDDATRYTVTYLMRTKAEAFGSYKAFEAWALAQQLCAAIKVLRSDRGGEYLSGAFDQHLAAAGTARCLTVHDTPQLNGVAERLNRTIVERIRAFTHSSGLPKFLWGEALRHATWLKNQMATRALDGLTPYQAVFGRAPDVSRLRRWGATVWVHVGDGDKFAARAREGRWLGFDTESRAHRIYFPSSHSVATERNVYFGMAPQLEGEQLAIPGTESEQRAALPTPTTILPPALPPTQVPLLPSPTVTLPSPLSSRSSSPSPPPAVTRVVPNLQERPTRNRKPAPVLRDLLKGVTTSSSRRSDPRFPVGTQLPGGFGEETEEAGGVWSAENAFAALKDLEWLEYVLVAEIAAAEALEPSTLAEAKCRPDWSLWEKAIEEELATLKAAGTWQLEEAPPGANIIGLKWVFKVKKDAAGNIAQYKARLVAQGFSQIGGIDYDDTYAPVAKLASSRAIIAMANRLHLILHQIDIKGAYLNGTLKDDEVLYLRHPPGYTAPNAGKQVLRLLKALYGLKQAGRRWYQTFTDILVQLGFTQCSVDQAVYHKSNASARELMVIAVHVDDCTIAASERRLVDDFKARLSKHVEVTDLGELHWMLGIEVKRNREAGTVHLSQRSYIDSILHCFNFADLKPLTTPMDVQAPATTAEFAAMRNIPYREAVGALNWAALATRPDISFAVSTVARFALNPGPAHWEAVKRIFHYLAGTRDLWLSYGEARRTLVGYTDADSSMAEDHHAISGYAFLIDGGTVSWSSKRQEIVSLSTTESEYVAAMHGLKEAMWLRSLLSEVFGSFKDATVLLCDNQSAIALARDHQYHARTKHIDVRYHFIRWVVDQGVVWLMYCPTEDMVADVLTKALPSPKVKHFAAGLGLCAK
jgi:transposase InsO family protein